MSETAAASEPIAIRVYRPYLLRWKLAAAFWLGGWWTFVLGGGVAAAVVAADPDLVVGGPDGFPLGKVLRWFVLGAAVLSNVLKPWRFHRGYQRAAYLLQESLDEATVDPKQARKLPAIIKQGHALILKGGEDLDSIDGLVSRTGLASAANHGTHDRDASS